MSHDHSAVIPEASEIVYRIAGPGLAYHTRRRREKELAARLDEIRAEAVATERSRVHLLMEQGSGDGLEDGSFTLPASVAREIVEP